MNRYFVPKGSKQVLYGQPEDSFVTRHIADAADPGVAELIADTMNATDISQYRGADAADAADKPDAAAATESGSLLDAVAKTIKKGYFIHTRNERKAYEVATDVLQTVQTFYEAEAARESAKGRPQG